MPSHFHHLDGMSIFDDKGEVKRLVEQILYGLDPEVTLERMRKMDFSYIFILSKRGRKKEIELSRLEIESSWEWRKGNIDETLQEKIRTVLSEFE